MIIQRKRVAKRLASGLLAGALALGGLAISGGTASAKTPSSPSTYRISGDDRYETAVAVARDYYTTAGDFGKKGIIIASGETPFDALAAAPLAGLKDAPIVLVKKDSLPSSVADLLDDYKSNFRANALTQKIYVIGGTAAISDDVVSAITTITDGATATQKMPVVRLAGDDRYKTAAAITSVAGLMDANDRLIIVNGTNWADALAAGPVAAWKKWPIMLTGNGGLNDDAKAVVETFRKIAGSTKDILLVGGPAVLPGSIEEYLDSKTVRFSDVDRRGGIDRYHTSFLMNLYVLNSGYAVLGAEGGLTSPFAGTDVALVSGESPWDALAAGPWAAKKSYHMQLTKSAGVDTFSAALAGALGNENFNLPTNLRIVGGKAAVSQATRDGFIAAASANNTTSSLSCTVKSTKVYLTIAGGLTAAESESVTKSANYGNYFTKNGVKHSTTSFLTGNGAGYSVDATGAADLTTLVMTMSSAAAAADVIAFTGIPEGTDAGISRSIAGSSCTVAADATGPTATVKFVVKSGVFDHALVTLSEAHQQHGSGAAATDTATSLIATSSWKYADGTQVFTAAASSTLSATSIDSKTWLVSLSAASKTYSNVTIAAGTAVYLVGANVKDLSGNAMASDSGATAAVDQTAPTMSIGEISCVADAKTKLVRNGLTLEAASKGVGTNAWTLTVVNQRGILTPTIVEDKVAKTVTITADTGYHTTDDLVNIAKNTGINAGTWTYSGTGTIAAATTLGPVNYLTAGAGGRAGDQDCSATVTFSEPVTVSTGSIAATVSNIAASAVSLKETDYSTSLGATTYYTEAQLFFTTTGSGPVNLTGVAATDRDGGNNMPSTTNTGATLS